MLLLWGISRKLEIIQVLLKHRCPVLSMVLTDWVPGKGGWKDPFSGPLPLTCSRLFSVEMNGLPRNRGRFWRRVSLSFKEHLLYYFHSYTVKIISSNVVTPKGNLILPNCCICENHIWIICRKAVEFLPKDFITVSLWAWRNEHICQYCLYWFLYTPGSGRTRNSGILGELMQFGNMGITAPCCCAAGRK